MSITTAVIAVIAALVIGLVIGNRGSFAVALVGLIMGDVIKRFALPAVIVLAVAAVAVGGVAALAGGSFLVAAKYTFFGGAAVALVGLLLRAIAATFKGF